MNKFEGKYFHTARLMDQALIELLDKKDYEFITVKEICEKAGVNRSTFYLHYESMDDLLAESLEYVKEKFLSYYDEHCVEDLPKIRTDAPAELNFVNSRYLTPYLKYIRENTKIFKAALDKPYLMDSDKRFDELYRDLVEPILERFCVAEAEKRYMVEFYLHGIIAVIRLWIANDFCDPIEYIVGLIEKYCSSPPKTL